MRSGAEIKVGLITLIAIILVGAYLFYIRDLLGAARAYHVCVTFDSARGLEPGDPVRMVGVRIGKVDSVEIDEIGRELKAKVTLAIDKGYDLYENYTFQIVTSGIISELFVEVLPVREPGDPGAKMVEGFCVDGEVQPTLRDLSEAGSKLLANLNSLINKETLDGLSSTLEAFEAAASHASDLAATTAALADESKPEIMAALENLEGASADLRAATLRVTEGSTLDDVEETMRYARGTAANAEEMSAAVAALVGDPQVQQQLRDTLAAIRAASLRADKILEDLQAVSAELREAAPVIPVVAEEAGEIAGAAESVREALAVPDIAATFDVAYSGKADRWFPTGYLDFHTKPERFVRLGLDDIGEESDVTAQVGDEYEKVTFRYGLVRSRLGLGMDFKLPRRSVLSVDLFDPNNPRADILADVPITGGPTEWSMLLGARDVGDQDLLVGGVRLKR